MRLLYLWGPVIAHMAAIFAASSSSDPSPVPSAVSDKVLHFGAYAVLGALVARALGGLPTRPVGTATVILATVLSTLYGATDEWHQSFVPGRTPDAVDLIADGAGAAAGASGWAAVAAWWARRCRGRQAPNPP